MAHQGVFKVDGADPFAAGFHQVLGAVHDLDDAIFVDHGDVASLEPAVSGPAMGLVGSLKVAAGYPWAPDFELAWGDAVPRCLTLAGAFGAVRSVGAHDAQLDERSGPALAGANVVLRVFLPIEHVRFEFADGGQGRGFGHAPKVQVVDVVLVESADEALGRRRAAAEDADGPIKLPAAGMIFKIVEETEPDGGDATGEGDALVAHQVEDAFAIDVGAGEDQAGPGHGAGVGQAPG